MTNSVVLDASALVAGLVDQQRQDPLDALVADRAFDLVVPHVCDLEVLSALRKAVFRSVLQPEGAWRALSVYRDLPLQRFPHRPLLGRVFELRDNFTPYDAVYVALAEVMAAPLYTADARLVHAVRDWTELEVVEV
jgi:predicted nucleic acid-binding protein